MELVCEEAGWERAHERYGACVATAKAIDPTVLSHPPRAILPNGLAARDGRQACNGFRRIRSKRQLSCRA
eukprot:6174773-Pleurochrysis_carterae.AAC.1